MPSNHLDLNPEESDGYACRIPLDSDVVSCSILPNFFDSNNPLLLSAQIKNRWDVLKAKRAGHMSIHGNRYL
jgi:hypothetical protein